MPNKKGTKSKTQHNHLNFRKLDVKQLSTMSWRILRILAEFIEGFEFLTQFQKEVSIFGSARIPQNTKWTKEAEKLGTLLAEGGYTVITGGGPAIMEAANKGAYNIHPERSVGINIELPHEQRQNKYVTKGKGFHYFFTRKVMLAASSQAYVFFPGGFGTLDEFSEILELVQTKKTEKLAIILIDKDFWQPMLDWMQNTLLKKYNTISAADLKLIKVVNSAEEAMPIIRKSKEREVF